MILAMSKLLTLFLFLFFSSTAFAQTLFVGSQNEYNLLPYASLYNDNSQKMTLEEVQKKSWIDVTVDELAFPVSPTAHWLKYSIENNSTQTKSYYLEYDVSTINFLDVYVLDNGKMTQRYLTGAHRPLENRAVTYHAYLFPITLNAGEQKEIYVRMKHLFSTIPANMILKEQNALLLDDYGKNVLQGVFFGVMIVMFLYNLVLYMMTRYRPYLAYILYLGSFGVWLSLRMGYGVFIFDFISVDLYRYFEISISILFTVFIIWFITGVLELQKVMPRIYRVFTGIAALFLLSWLSIIVLLFFGIEGYYEYPSLLFFLNFLVMNVMIVAVTAMLAWRGNKTALYLFLAWMLFVSSMVILTLSLTSVIPPYNWIMPYMQFTMVVETVMLSLILGDRFRQQEQLLSQQSRLASMGSMIENIAHQWRQPLSEINADLLALEIHIENGDNERIKKSMGIIEEKTDMMSKTIDSFQNFYAKDKEKVTFDLEKLIEKSLDLLEDRMQVNHVKYTHMQCRTNAKETFKLYGVENEYLQVLLAIINNAIDVLIENDKEDRKLDITLSREGIDTVLKITNNGKQIKSRDIQRVFEPYYTTKESRDQNGIGLFMSKKIIEESFHGNLEIENVSEGVKVTVKVAYV